MSSTEQEISREAKQKPKQKPKRPACVHEIKPKAKT